MYTPAKFKQSDLTELQAFIAAHPLATLIAQSADGIAAAHLPLLWHDDGSEFGALHGHFAKANPLWQTALPDSAWLVIFQNNGHYISPNWYPSKARDHKAVPTWNYQAVHIRGRLNIIRDQAAIHAILDKLSTVHEQNQPRPWSPADAPADYIDALCRAIVCFEIPIERIEGKYKLSQNQPADNRRGIVAGLRQMQQPEAEKMANLVARFAPENENLEAV
ncbi:MAG: FMN-binding negative transcriptional regulator [Neisseria sp.]|nr:FMN-binding negative transcriptional regulator [Neisseria sp.]